MESQKLLPANIAAPAALTPEAIADLLRVGEAGNEIGAYLDTIFSETKIPGSKALIRWHRIAHDGTFDKPDVQKLVRKLVRLVIDFACTRSEIEAALSHWKNTKSTEGLTALHEKARRLFTKAKRSGEVGDLLLFYLTERLLKYPQILCKMPLKTNPNMHAHGADGVHASLNAETKHLRLHWGEAKLYANFEAALKDCCISLREMLRSPAGAKKTKERDLELLQDYLDLDNTLVEEAIKQYLDPDNVLSNNVEFCGVALIGFNYKEYQSLCDEFKKPDAAAIAVRTAEWTEKITNALKDHELVELTVDVLCIPCTSVEEIRSEFKKALGI